jgi:putative DNA primase/helicase
LGASFREAAQRIEQIVGAHKPDSQAWRGDQRERTAQARHKHLRAGLWREAKPVERGDPVDHWLRTRGLAFDIFPASLRFAPILYHGPEPHPGMVAAMQPPAGGNAVQLHRTFLPREGDKAVARTFAPGMLPPGAAVRLCSATNIIGVAEGIETAFAAMKLFGVPCWAACTADQLSKFEPPKDVEKVVVFGDNDTNGTGQRAAYTLAAKLTGKVKIETAIPTEVGDDWNDMLRKGGG